MVEEQQKRCAKLAALLTGHASDPLLDSAPEPPDNIKRLHAAGYTNVTRASLSIAPSLLMARMGKPEGLDQLRLWLDCGGDVDAQMRNGGRLLISAISHCNADAVALLISRGASTEGALKEVCSVEEVEGYPGRVEMAQLLLRHGASTEGALHQLCRVKGSSIVPLTKGPSESLQLARLLVDAGEDVNAVRDGPYGTKMVPLRDAVLGPSGGVQETRNDDLVHFLLARGAKTDWYEQLWRTCGGIPPSNSRKLIAVVLAAGGWRKYTLPPRKDMLVLRELCEKDRAKPSAPFERLFALPKGVFWRVIGFWRSHLDEPHAIDDEEYTAALAKQPTAQEYNYHRVARVMPGMNLDAAGAEAFRQQLLALNLIPADAALPAPREQPARDAVAGRVVLAARVNGETFELPNPPTAALRPGDALSLVPEIVHEGEALDAARRRPGIIEGTVSTSVATAGVAAEVTAAEETAETPIGRATRLRREARRRAREQR